MSAATPDPLRVGIIGAGKISGQYADTLTGLPQVRVTAVADLDATRAEVLAARFPGARTVPAGELTTADDVDLVLGLTLPATHAEVALAALAAGKHVYTEKPLALTVQEGREVVARAAERGLRVGCAPDTVLGTGVQTARAVIERGELGLPHAATAFMTTPGHERWHPDPEFYYRPGGGPLLDMGPYYISALVHLLGPVTRVVGLSSRPSATRTIGSGPRAGAAFDVDVDTHVTGVLQHAGGALSTLVMSFDTWAARLPRIEVYGTGGSLSVPDPNYFGGGVELYTAAAGQWRPVEPCAGYVGAGRGTGVADLAVELSQGRPHRAGAELGLHVLDVMQSLLLAAREGTSVAVGTSVEVPVAVPGLVVLA